MKETKYLQDLAKVTTILEKEKLTTVDKLNLINVYNVAYHDSGKIEGIASLDGSAVSCEFCKTMQASAKNDPTIVCGGCYAKALDEYRVGCEHRHWLNQLIMKSVQFTVEQLKTLYIPCKITRFNSDGDFENATQAINAFRTCKAHKENLFAIWTKNLPALKEAYRKEGKPRNLIIVYSSCRLNESREDLFNLYPWIDYVFTVYATKDATQEAIDNGANECNGKKCKDCGFKCYTGGWKKHTNIAEYLRGVNPQNRKELVKAIKKRLNK